VAAFNQDSLHSPEGWIAMRIEPSVVAAVVRERCIRSPQRQWRNLGIPDQSCIILKQGMSPLVTSRRVGFSA
jgi:hypothetical protein